MMLALFNIFNLVQYGLYVVVIFGLYMVQIYGPTLDQHEAMKTCRALALNWTTVSIFCASMTQSKKKIEPFWSKPTWPEAQKAWGGLTRTIVEPIFVHDRVCWRSCALPVVACWRYNFACWTQICSTVRIILILVHSMFVSKVRYKTFVC